MIIIISFFYMFTLRLLISIRVYLCVFSIDPILTFIDHKYTPKTASINTFLVLHIVAFV